MSLKRLTISEAISMVILAQNQCKTTPTYRLGQALYNLLPSEKYQDHQEVLDAPDHYRWYQSLDNTFCVQYFYSTFVDYGDDNGRAIS